jgi:hypothetical protein
MTGFRATRRSAVVLAVVLAVMLACMSAPGPARANTAAANTCAAGLSKDAKSIFDATLPKVGPGVDLKSVVTSTTRGLAMAGTIGVGTARESAEEAGTCLKKATP